MIKRNVKAMKNPFLMYGYEGPEYFCDRLQETELITSALLSGRNITLIAPRRMGKTGLIKNVFHRLHSQYADAVCIYFDIFSTNSAYEFTQLFGARVIEEALTRSEHFLQEAATLFRSCKPAVSTNGMTGELTVRLDFAHTQTEQSLDEVFGYLKQNGRHFFIAIDEFQQITAYREKGFEALLRSYMQFLPNVHFVFSGSIRHLISDMFLSAKRPFYQSTQLVNLGPIGLSAYQDFASGFFGSSGGRLEREVFEWIYNRYEGHTWYVQAVLNRLYERYMSVTQTEQARRVILEIVNENTPYYEHLRRLITDKQAALLKAVAREGKVKAPTGSAFLSKYRLGAASSVSGMLTALTDKELLYADEAGYSVYDRFLGEWLAWQD
ncbi:AAA family ATPase [Prevotella sp. kh1p2]|uniref:AAA family ATPase n=1 Tax=Prevotella sp. kh1p2 TaxID=1761883 RepID=UPI000B83AE7B|nr:ATP-binding protein [Prevotella sp. kh1p2]